MRSVSSPIAVSMTIGHVGLKLRSQRAKSSPLSPGSIRSSTTRWKWPSGQARRASRASRTAVTRKRWRSRKRASRSRISRSSSTTRICGITPPGAVVSMAPSICQSPGFPHGRVALRIISLRGAGAQESRNRVDLSPPPARARAGLAALAAADPDLGAHRGGGRPAALAAARRRVSRPAAGDRRPADQQPGGGGDLAAAARHRRARWNPRGCWRCRRGAARGRAVAAEDRPCPRPGGGLRRRAG